MLRIVVTKRISLIFTSDIKDWFFGFQYDNSIKAWKRYRFHYLPCCRFTIFVNSKENYQKGGKFC